MAHTKLFLLALSFYTRLPVPQNLDYGQLPKAANYLPLVGWVVGSLVAGCFYLAAWIWPQSVAVILALALGVWLTGAFHEDGFADVCDGFGGGYDKGRILAIMKDSQIGAYGALGLFLLMSLKISSLFTLPSQVIPLVIFAAHSISRFPPLVLMHAFDYSRVEPSKSTMAMHKPNKLELILSGSSALLPLLFLPLLCLLVVPVIMLVNWRLGRFFFRHIGGYTGDCLGASQQVAETVFYLSLAALWKYT